MRKITFISIVLFLVSCAGDDSTNDTILSNYVLGKAIEEGGVIACAGSSENSSKVLVFQYPENGARNTKLYETNTVDIDEKDFSNYKKVSITGSPFFNGYLEQFDLDLTQEKWIIVTHELDGEIKISNPIRTKQNTKASKWSQSAVEITQEEPLMPRFTWENNQFGDNAIYFQIVSDLQNNLLSGTYTFENTFQYYNTSNVVLNITIDIPPILRKGAEYNFTLMDVSEDNWVNLFILNKKFLVE